MPVHLCSHLLAFHLFSPAEAADKIKESFVAQAMRALDRFGRFLERNPGAARQVAAVQSVMAAAAAAAAIAPITVPMPLSTSPAAADQIPMLQAVGTSPAATPRGPSPVSGSCCFLLALFLIALGKGDGSKRESKNRRGAL